MRTRSSPARLRNINRRAGLLAKTPSGIRGLDEVTNGGLPRGRPTLICGRAGCGKTLLSVEFLVRGAIQYDEPGVFLAFEENEEDLTKNVASLGYDLRALCRRKKLVIDYVHLERSEIEETGEFDLGGLFVRLGHAIDSIGAKRVVLDTVEALFAGLPNSGILRAELRRLFRWLKDRGVTAVITAERGDGTLTRNGLEEYVSDCVILLDHRVHEQVSTRRLRIVKYRGSTHGTNEYPFLIDEHGFSVLPITSIGLQHRASTERISTGIADLDRMLGGKGYYRGSSILISGTAGTGKTSVAAHFVDAACRRGERCAYFASEESSAQIMRNLRSIGLDLEPWVKKRLLHFDTTRPTFYGLEMHLLRIHKIIAQLRPKIVVFDPSTTFLSLGDNLEVKLMLTRLIDYLKLSQITSLFNSLTEGGTAETRTELGVSSLMDTWILLQNLAGNGERNFGLCILKSRGMAHSRQIREYNFTDGGIELREIYGGQEGVLSGSARAAQEAKEKASARVRLDATQRKVRELESRRRAVEAQIEAMRTKFESEAAELTMEITQETEREQLLIKNSAEQAALRWAGSNARLKRSRNGQAR